MVKKGKKVNLKFENVNSDKFQTITKAEMDQLTGGNTEVYEVMDTMCFAIKGWTESAGFKCKDGAWYSNDWTKDGGDGKKYVGGLGNGLDLSEAVQQVRINRGLVS